MRRLHAVSRGIPRIVNQLATQCLLEGMARGVTSLDEAVVASVAKGQAFLQEAS
jgi:type II secretory pathway predicted ATPase ExeA